MDLSDHIMHHQHHIINLMGLYLLMDHINNLKDLKVKTHMENKEP